VLTRLPPPHRADPLIARDFLAARFPQPLLRMTPADRRRFVLGLREQGVSGGAAYDRRAASVYERYGVRWRLVRSMDRVSAVCMTGPLDQVSVTGTEPIGLGDRGVRSRLVAASDG
jgi:hypothetical protein